jgi:hypothetical protein
MSAKKSFEPVSKRAMNRVVDDVLHSDKFFMVQPSALRNQQNPTEKKAK